MRSRCSSPVALTPFSSFRGPRADSDDRACPGCAEGREPRVGLAMAGRDDGRRSGAAKLYTDGRVGGPFVAADAYNVGMRPQNNCTSRNGPAMGREPSRRSFGAEERRGTASVADGWAPRVRGGVAMACFVLRRRARHGDNAWGRAAGCRWSERKGLRHERRDGESRIAWVAVSSGDGVGVESSRLGRRTESRAGDGLHLPTAWAA